MSALASLPADIARRRVVKTKDAAAFIGLSVPTLRRRLKTKDVPAPIKLSDRLFGWRMGDLSDFLDCREAGREWKDCQGAKADHA